MTPAAPVPPRTASPVSREPSSSRWGPASARLAPTRVVPGPGDLVLPRATRARGVPTGAPATGALLALPLLLLLAAVLPACADPEGDTSPGGKDPVGTDSGTVTDSPSDSPVDSPTDSEPEVDCAALPPLPAEAETLRGFTPSEDFAFDGAGNVVSVDENLNLVRVTAGGEIQVWLPRFGEASGMRFLPGGDLVIGNPADGAVYRVTPDGDSWILISGLAYPNGLEVDADGFVYVSEQGGGRVRRVDPDTGDWTVVAADLYNPNGLSFSGDYQTLYVGSFGDGTVTAVDRDGEGWAASRLYAATTDAPFYERGGGCDGLASGDTCLMDYGGVGTCDAASSCIEAPDLAACAERVAGDTCTTTLFDQSIESVCTADIDGLLFCPRAETGRLEACVDVAEYGACRYDGTAGYCLSSWEGIAECVTGVEYEEGLYGDCGERAEGDACVSTFQPGPWVGTCTDYSGYGFRELLCAPPGGAFSERGGLDGINVDACDNVYVTEYVKGSVWRFSGEGAAPELVAALDSTWIPNLHWGFGEGWDPRTAYVADRERGRLFAIPLGVGEKPRAYLPAE